MGTITSLLHDMKAGQEGAQNQLFEYVYKDLKRVAKRFSRNNPNAPFQTTELLGEAYQRLAGKETLNAENRRHFFFLLSRAMQDVLVDQARRDLAEKRGGGIANRAPMVEVTWENSKDPIAVLDLQEALAELGEKQPEIARVVLLRIYAGMTLHEIAADTGDAYSKTRRAWDYAKAWLRERLTPPKPEAPPDQ